MARKKKKARSPTRTLVSDEEIVRRLEKDTSEVLRATMPEDWFDAALDGLLNEWPLPDEMPHFYCRKCGEYHLKTHAHYVQKDSIH